MKRLTVEPRTPAWHEIRAESWTASLAATLVVKENAELLQAYAAEKGVVLDIAPLVAVGMESFYGNTLWKVWAEKMGNIPRFGGNDHTARGTANEEKVIQHFEQSQLMMVEREVTATSSTHPWLLASFDAVAPASSDPASIAPFGFPVEAKCPAFHSRKKLFDSRKSGKLAVLGLPYYWCQVQHQIAVAQAPYGWFVAAGVEVDAETGEEKTVFPIVEKVPANEDFLAAYIPAAEFYHTHFIHNFTEPPKLPADEALLVSLKEKAIFDKALAEADSETAVELYLVALKEEKAVIARRAELEEKLLKAAETLREEGTDVVLLADRLKVTYASSSATSWQKVAKEVIKRAALEESVVTEIMDSNKSTRKSVKIQEVA